ncbi:GNAT family N-acetyltransferase [Virgibacillus soli]|uniref:GNAT family N-acetyltransferase n=1 Tax=Paracerasibacillus soli TaxID=480284 RepID=A0ABU5CVX8_9BACI|nr:GNAT family N-acetyltransferase [Virgibacillus soli]MDY0410405.1 GNAT family N-acetyltransferase [Virgibacillus soli]
MFETERCMIQSLKKADYHDVQELYFNEEVRKYLGGVRSISEDTMEKMLEIGAGEYHWTIREKQTNDFVGSVSLGPHHDGTYFEISYQLLPKWWGAGFATEVVQVILHFAFDHLKLPKIVAETQVANIPSCQLLERIGMKLERTTIRFGEKQAIYAMEVTAFSL